MASPITRVDGKDSSSGYDIMKMEKMPQDIEEIELQTKENHLHKNKGDSIQFIFRDDDSEDEGESAVVKKVRLQSPYLSGKREDLDNGIVE